jgi:hypothetical protein
MMKSPWWTATIVPVIVEVAAEALALADPRPRAATTAAAMVK